MPCPFTRPIRRSPFAAGWLLLCGALSAGAAEPAPPATLDSVQRAVTAADGSLRIANTAGTGNYVKKARADLAQASTDLTECRAYTDAHPDISQQPAALSPASLDLMARENAALTKLVPTLGRSRNYQRALQSLQTAFTDLQQIPGGSEGGARDRVIADLGQAVDDIIAGLEASNKAAAARSPTGAPAARAPAAAEPQVLHEEQMDGIVLIEGDKGVATGFIARIHDTVCVVTNLHVLVSNEKVTIKKLDGKMVVVQGVIGAVGADIALLRIADQSGTVSALDMADDVLQSAKIGDKVVVVGNMLGGGVATQISGTIMGVGPDRIEVNAAFQPGNSGSPIYDVASKQVVGVCTFVQTMTVDINGTPATAATKNDPGMQSKTRWFGYRLDSVTKWETLDWTKWRGQIQQVSDFYDTSLALLALYRGDLVEAGKNSRLRALIERFTSRLSPSELKAIPANPSESATSQVRDLLRSARAYSEEGLKDFTEADYYDYFRTNVYFRTSVPQQAKFRAQLVQAFKDLDGNLQPYERRLKP